MRDVNRIEPMLHNLKELWYKNPDFRLCQLLFMVASESGWLNNDLFYIEDSVIADQIKKELLRN